MTTSIISYLILRYGFGMDDPETFMKSMGIGVIAGIARLVYISHKREQEIEADAATESSTTTASSTEKTMKQTDNNMDGRQQDGNERPVSATARQAGHRV